MFFRFQFIPKYLNYLQKNFLLIFFSISFHGSKKMFNHLKVKEANGKTSEHHYEMDFNIAGNSSDHSCVCGGEIGFHFSNWRFHWWCIHRIIFIHVCSGHDQSIGEFKGFTSSEHIFLYSLSLSFSLRRDFFSFTLQFW